VLQCVTLSYIDWRTATRCSLTHVPLRYHVLQCVKFIDALQHATAWRTATRYSLTHCNTLQLDALHHTATLCYTLQHTTSHECVAQEECITKHDILQHTATHDITWMGRVNILQPNVTRDMTRFYCAAAAYALLQHTASHCITLRHTASLCNTLQHTATHCNTLQHTATHCNTLQHTATHCNTLCAYVGTWGTPIANPERNSRSCHMNESRHVNEACHMYVYMSHE